MTVSTESTKQLKYQLWKSDITPSKKEKEQKYSSELDRLIEQVRSIEIASQQSSEPKTTPETFPAIEPNNVSIKMSIPKEDAEDMRITESDSSYKSITDATIKTLRGLIQNPEKIKNPFETGEILFINGYLKEAALFYDEALIRTEPDAPGSPTDRSWLLFQKGNCLRNDEMTEAVEMYNQLIMEYPDSLWADMAQIQSQFISWYQTEQPQKIMDENK
jgi:tetratricopeptide (TPR) repeat protein